MSSVNALGARLEQRITELPVLPTVVGQLMVLDREEEGYFERVLELIESDPTFAARVMAAANGAASSPTNPISSVRSALARLGSSGASAMVLSVSVSRIFIPRDPWEKSLWRHALQVAGAARALTKYVDPGVTLSGDDAYTAGLLHDVGRLVMFGESPETLREIDEGSWESRDTLIALERSICGLTHTELGAMACEQWALPDSLADSVLRHHEPQTDVRGRTVEALIATVQFADLVMFPSAMPGTPGFVEAARRTVEDVLMPKVPTGLSVSAKDLHEVIVATAAQADATCAALGIS